MSSSKAAEVMFDSILQIAGYANIANEFNKEYLLSTADRVRPGRTTNVENKRKDVGKQTKWSVTSAKTVLDWVYGIDTVIAPSSNSLKFGFDVTLDPSKVKDKVDKLKSFAPLWQAVGITKAAVILIIPPKEFGFALLTEEQKENLIDQLLENVVYPMDEQSTLVRSYILTI